MTTPAASPTATAMHRAGSRPRFDVRAPIIAVRTAITTLPTMNGSRLLTAHLTFGSTRSIELTPQSLVGLVHSISSYRCGDTDRRTYAAADPPSPNTAPVMQPATPPVMAASIASSPVGPARRSRPRCRLPRPTGEHSMGLRRPGPAPSRTRALDPQRGVVPGRGPRWLRPGGNHAPAVHAALQ